MQVRYLQGDPRASLLEHDVPGDVVPGLPSFPHVHWQLHGLAPVQHVDASPHTVRRHGLRDPDRDASRFLS